MSTSITQSYVKDYNTDVQHKFQRMGGMLRGTVQLKDNVIGETTHFHFMGTGTATTKSRHGEITPMNVNHDLIACQLYDFYAGEWVDKLDEAKTNAQMRKEYAQAGAMALGRKVDNLIIEKLATTTQTDVTFTVTNPRTIRNSLLGMAETAWANNVPNDGQVFGLLTPRAFAQAMTVEEFSSADFVGSDGLPFKQGAPNFKKFKEWMGVKWAMHTGLPGFMTSSATCFLYHKYSVGFATGKHAGNIATNESVAADITWHGDRAAHFVNHCMSGGATLIDDLGVITATIDDTAAINSAA